MVHPASMLFGVWLSMTIGGCLSNWCPSFVSSIAPPVLGDVLCMGCSKLVETHVL